MDIKQAFLSRFNGRFDMFEVRCPFLHLLRFYGLV